MKSTDSSSTPAQLPLTPPRPKDEGQGPFQRLIIEGGVLVDGTGNPPYHATIIIEQNRIVEIRRNRFPDRLPPRPEHGPSDKLINARDTYILPGFIDTHIRLTNITSLTGSTEYLFKLFMGHGITTIGVLTDENQLDWVLELQRQSAENTASAPRIKALVNLNVHTPDEARAKVKELHLRGVTGIRGGEPQLSREVAKAALEEIKKLGLPVTWNMTMGQQPGLNALDLARLGVSGISHWYGMAEPFFVDRALRRYPAGFTWTDSRERFRQGGRTWKQAAPPYSDHWNKVLNEFLALDVTFEPTFDIYEAARDLMGVSRAEWLDEHLHPGLARSFTPSRNTNPFAPFYDWTTTDEVEWRDNFRLWMIFINEYKNRGGRVVAGADSGYLWAIPGFGFVRNLELLQEAGLAPLEVISSATLQGAELYHSNTELGSLEVGKLADLLIVDRNPLENLKVLYGTGVNSLNEDDVVTRVGGVKYTIKDGIVFDAKALLADVRKIAKNARARQVSSA
ncbi:amidohydrolase family protein [Mesorhizobium sp. M0991]|uniref:amidohydrolase family protein n=1 Tax=Mesorhizobium sp. M0991 TaxID=2957043 RepID=UPI00333A7EA9